LKFFTRSLAAPSPHRLFAEKGLGFVGTDPLPSFFFRKKRLFREGVIVQPKLEASIFENRSGKRKQSLLTKRKRLPVSGEAVVDAQRAYSSAS
jgi:hypothetical protein